MDGRNPLPNENAETAIRERPTFSLPHCTAATSAAHLGQLEAAHKFMARAREIVPELSLSNATRIVAFRRCEDYDRWLEGLRVAGLPE